MRLVRYQKDSGTAGGRRLIVGLLMTVALVALGVPFAASAPAQSAQHGITFVKGCQPETVVLQKTMCDFGVHNDFDPDTLQIVSIVDVVHGGAGDDNSGNILSQLQLSFEGGATCNQAQTLCTLP